jgi:SAM-dependent methyltransferase
MVDGSGMKARDAGDREMARAVKLTALSGTPIGRCLSSGWRLLCRTPLEWAIKSTQEKGLIQTGKVVGTIAMDLWFDWKYRTDTMRWIDRAALDTSSENKLHSTSYQATKARPFLKLLRELRLSKDAVFVDIGSGKGRALLLASQFGFRKVVGLEFSGALCEVARENVRIFSRKVPLGSVIEIHEIDATLYQFQAEDNVLFMYNPFKATVLAEVLRNVGLSLEKNPRKLWLIYNTPEHRKVVEESKLFKTASFYEIGGNHFWVYET